MRENVITIQTIIVSSRQRKSIIMAYKSLDIANKLLAKAESVCGGDLMSNMKLQKMLYYEQGYHLAAFGTPLFDDDVEAWMYGPVVPSVYDHFKHHKAGGIEPETEDAVMLSEEEEELFNDVFDAYADFSAYGLMQKTHQESPWKDTQVGPGNVISQEKMQVFFSKKLANA